MIGLTVFVPIVKFTSVVIQTAKILTPKNALAAMGHGLPNGKMTVTRQAVSRIVQQIISVTLAKLRESTHAPPVLNSGARQDGKHRVISISED